MSGPQLSAHKELLLTRRRRLYGWLAFQALAPYAVVVVCWLAAKYISRVQFAYEKNFVGGDLILIGALLLIGSAVEIWSEQDVIKNIQTRWDIIFITVIVSAVLFLVIFGFIKNESLQSEFPSKSAGANRALTLDPRICTCVGASLAGGTFALVLSLLATVYLYRCIMQAEEEAIGKVPTESKS